MQPSRDLHPDNQPVDVDKEASDLLPSQLLRDLEGRNSLLSARQLSTKLELSPAGSSLEIPKALESVESNRQIAKSAESFARANHFELEARGNDFVYGMQVGGKKLELIRTPATEKGLREAEEQLKELVRQEAINLEKTYKISIAQQGEPVDYQRSSSDSPKSDHIVLARAPELFDLYGVRAALEKSPSSASGRDGQGLKFFWLNEKVITEIGPYATFQTDQNGRGSVYIWPAAREIKHATEDDLTESQRKISYYTREREVSWQSIILHELGHNTADKLGYEKKSSVNEIVSELSAAGEKLAEDIGWVKRRDVENSGEDWLLVGKSVDDNGKPATFVPDHNNIFFSSYLRWRADGGAVNAKGKVVPAHEGQKLSEQEMMAEALVTPPTFYFDNPAELYAEGMKLYRLGDSARSHLQKVSPKLYEIVKRDNQREIDFPKLASPKID